ncbi:hypothetical protein HYH03_015898 [Edaphochlamys debaryana]|uniref:Uncharacterized protein n=1 Tax=Edaphochlamys debaryana TaxID=47281 RepID=A0A836BQU6_9CHLO|nr:hypothetical protein HYH03_015898 [Edaphochlamys debaryana]|eukprot:KAG2485412.1 hypothetical protein HYH03_015898 [Edaphochlamys debaryana]
MANQQASDPPAMEPRRCAGLYDAATAPRAGGGADRSGAGDQPGTEEHGAVLAAEAEVDWALLPRELLQQARWVAAARAVPAFSRALVEVKREDVLRGRPRELFFALELLWRRHERRRQWPVERSLEQGSVAAGLEEEDGALRAADLEPAAWDLDDPAWRQGRWEEAKRMMRSPEFPERALHGGIPLGTAALTLLRRRTGAASGSGSEPGPRLPLLVPTEVAAHSATAGGLAKWLMGTQELLGAGCEVAMAHFWIWPKIFAWDLEIALSASAPKIHKDSASAQLAYDTARAEHMGSVVTSVAAAAKLAGAKQHVLSLARWSAVSTFGSLQAIVSAVSPRLAELGLAGLPALPPEDVALSEMLAAAEQVREALAAAAAEGAGLTAALLNATEVVSHLQYLVREAEAKEENIEEQVQGLLKKFDD